MVMRARRRTASREPGGSPCCWATNRPSLIREEPAALLLVRPLGSKRGAQNKAKQIELGDNLEPKG